MKKLLLAVMLLFAVTYAEPAEASSHYFMDGPDVGWAITTAASGIGGWYLGEAINSLMLLPNYSLLFGGPGVPGVAAVAVSHWTAATLINVVLMMTGGLTATYWYYKH